MCGVLVTAQPSHSSYCRKASCFFRTMGSVTNTSAGPRCRQEETGENMRNQKGQGLVEYTLIVVLVSLVFWTGVKNTKVGSSLQGQWGNVRDCVALKLTVPDCRLSGGGNNGGGNGGGNNGGGNNGGGNNGGGNGGNNH